MHRGPFPALLLLTALGCSSSPDTRPEPQAPPDAGTPVAEPQVPDRASCQGLSAGPGTHDWTVTHDGRERAYRVHVPPGYDATRPTPTVVAFHGYGSHPEQLERQTGLSTLADTEGFLVVYPRGLSAQELNGGPPPPPQDNTRGWNGGACCGSSQLSQVDDVGFVDAMMADLDTHVCVDPRRTFATGFSNGGFFSYRLACERAGRFAAVAPVSGMAPSSGCSPSRPVPVLHIHGTEDTVILYEGGSNIPFGRPYPSARDSVRGQAERNGCGGPEEQTYQRGNSTCVAFTGCTPESATASLCTVQGGNHSWPGSPVSSGNPTRDLDASLEAWRFFQGRPRP
ncbi:alpha/beta hydrolase family esterase [Myxococcus faecalis]|uniref:extracellular catalytic domain type 1 short-chain-length polyhydroxyalkanoate depolymerase n=1 Tax=Myxococcus faecalis TaxID=3115646 RepID=UPI0038CFA8FC